MNDVRYKSVTAYLKPNEGGKVNSLLSPLRLPVPPPRHPTLFLPMP
jgi:hypothetical protein